MLFVPCFPECSPREGWGVGGQTSDYASLGMRGAQMQATRLYSQKSVVKGTVLCYGEFCLLCMMLVGGG